MIILALGTNMGDRFNQLHRARQKIGAFFNIRHCSDIYETAPQYLTNQPMFLNAVMAGETALSPLDLLRACKHVEKELGRTTAPRFGPRCIDVDVVMYGDAVMQCDELILPHPRMHERGFVLHPLCDILPNIMHPIHQKTIADMCHELAASDPGKKISWPPST
ncbi:MAG: 2-amino-4-hydroxy-6-hydroxymethyldihydropteridine diphosphokinase [Alphaproteobacteria bacterium]|nr:2-amino-4-hydroxy-6-hydroxymethyldihydropteridine diphosphokinase [Alphaproteobacteria bacterium]NDC55585.1 2-amino-4-hydroxy-6-hydroxymethyldihydropteridine diphosphokinase [Alphaproteobacteria bacterium]NDG04514.1 2-amino-4-hydroxy-6-hydroxymethyldihydropteridine diphosphokinase [Alphaproteobacteria bacterium]